MASKKAQVVLAANARNKNVITADGVTSGVITRSKAIALFAASSTPTSTLPKEQEHPRHEPVITLASLRAPRKESPMKYSGSTLSDVDSSGSSAMQVMTTGATLIDEQLAYVNEAIARLTRIVEEKDQQIAALVNQLDVKPDVKIEQGDDSVKKENDEDEEPPVEKIDYEGSLHDSVLYSKPYSKKIDTLKMLRGYQPPKFMQFDGKGNPNNMSPISLRLATTRGQKEITSLSSLYAR
ncbi:hypothetical protein ACFX2B_014156 [Malus domestica]